MAYLYRYDEENLPAVDIFVCTADPILEPPCMTINTVLSAMAYNYPANKLSVYLSDDGGSELTFYALLKASIFSKHWLPFCRRFNVEPMSPEAFFAAPHSSNNSTEYGQAWLFIKVTDFFFFFYVELSMVIYVHIMLSSNARMA